MKSRKVEYTFDTAERVKGDAQLEAERAGFSVHVNGADDYFVVQNDAPVPNLPYYENAHDAWIAAAAYAGGKGLSYNCLGTPAAVA
jgi:hypothetical protein